MRTLRQIPPQALPSFPFPDRIPTRSIPFAGSTGLRGRKQIHEVSSVRRPAAFGPRSYEPGRLLFRSGTAIATRVAGNRDRRIPRVVLALLLAAESGFVGADTVYDGCFDDAGSRYGVAPALLEAIARAESGLDPTARNANRNGSTDVGLMQINSRWLSRLAEHGIDASALWDPCLNVHVGAWILAQSIRRYGYNWTAVGAYNAGTGRDAATERRRRAYAARVSRHLPRARGVGVQHGVRPAVAGRPGVGGAPTEPARDRAAAGASAGTAGPLVRDLQPVSRADEEDARRNRG